MNLVEIEIQDFKQFHGVHHFQPGEHTMAAIIGPNGVGKTTLFEALEWALYGTSSSKNAELRNRFLKGSPRVKVTLEHPRTGDRFEVERELKGNSANAAVYSSADPSRPIVQGPKEVNRFVTSKLTGLSSRAFASTFFTRQKELSFFGDMRPTERRREVGKLLGFETIRRAQERIAERRRDKRAEAQSKEQLRESEMAGIDLDEVRRTRELERASSEATVQSASRALDSALSDLNVSRARLSELRKIERQFQELATIIVKVTGRIDTANSEARSLETDLERISKAESESARLQPLADQVIELQATIEHHRKLERAAMRIATLQDGIDEQTKTLERHQSALIAAVSQSTHPVVPEWNTKGATVEDFVPEVKRLQAVVAEIDLVAQETQLAIMEQSVSASAQLEREQTKLREYKAQAAKYQQEIDELGKNGDPDTRLNALRSRQTVLREERARCEARVKDVRTRIADFDLVLGRLSESGQLGECPTCGRPFEQGEKPRVSESIRRQINELKSEAGDNSRRSQQLDIEVRNVAQDEQRLQDDATTLADRRARLEKGHEIIDAQKQTVSEAQQKLTDVFEDLGREHIPDEQELRNLRDSLNALRAITSQGAVLKNIEEGFVSAREKRSTLQQEMQSIGLVEYDAKLHKQVEQALTEARDAVSQIATLKNQIAERETIESKLKNLRSELVQLQRQLESRKQEQRDLGFDHQTLELAEESEKKLEAARLAADSSRNQAEAALASAARSIDELDRFEARMDTLAQDAIAARRSADDLDRMYREFGRFDQFVAASLTPHLEDLSSDLLATVTDGRYDRLRFDENFGIEVFDGDQGPFPVTQFSGGERDAISLCARLALSQLVGGNAVHPIQFLVLDEVFGALDHDRRDNVLLMLQSLVAENDAFRQLFVISHIDEVRANGTLDEVWQVVETGQGMSKLERVGVEALTA